MILLIVKSWNFLCLLNKIRFLLLMAGATKAIDEILGRIIYSGHVRAVYDVVDQFILLV